MYYLLSGNLLFLLFCGLGFGFHSVIVSTRALRRPRYVVCRDTRCIRVLGEIEYLSLHNNI